MRPIGKSGTTWSWNNHCVTYVQHFNISNDCNPTTPRQRCSNGFHMGDIIPVSTEGASKSCPPLCGHLSHSIHNMERASEFWLNHFWDKDAFFSLGIMCMLRRQNYGKLDMVLIVVDQSLTLHSCSIQILVEPDDGCREKLRVRPVCQYLFPSRAASESLNNNSNY